jgi:membrane-bound lytic murein transglycosylase D
VNPDVRNAPVEALVREADGHFQSGRKLYQQGEEAAARREFDRAIDLLLSGPEGPNVRSAVDKKLDELVDSIHRLDLAGLGSADTASEPQFEKPPLEDIPQLTFPVDPKLKDKVAEELRATVSQLPLEVTDPVLSYVNYFSTGHGRKVLISGLRRAGRYRPLIQRILDEEGVPQELIYLAQAESGFLPRVISRAKAAGMWQFVLLRGREYGLAQTPYSDERFDPEKATRAAARHLRDLYKHYGDWYLAMAAYNCGPGNIDKAVERTGYADFWELRRRNVIPRESSNYVPVILAMTIMVKNAKEYGLENLEAEPPLEYDTVEITAPTHLQLAADLSDYPLPQIRDLNPALLKDMAPARASLRVPKGTGSALAAALETIPADKRASWRAHRVVDGDTLETIARRYRVTGSSIASANRSEMREFEPGDMLIIPAAAAVQPSAKRKRGPYRTASRKAGVRHRSTTASIHGASSPVSYTARNLAPPTAKHAPVKR